MGKSGTYGEFYWEVINGSILKVYSYWHRIEALYTCEIEATNCEQLDQWVREKIDQNRDKLQRLAIEDRGVRR